MGAFFHCLIFAISVAAPTGDARLPGYVLTMKDRKWNLREAHPSLPCTK
tara:strand:- start:1502 stop:1648 length:147 start_codon:yes stop_codon:yes gene_type:complete